MFNKKYDKQQNEEMLKDIKAQIVVNDTTTVGKLMESKKLIQDFLDNLYENRKKLERLIKKSKKARDDLKKQIKLRNL